MSFFDDKKKKFSGLRETDDESPIYFFLSF
jgi:hypothetical protein